MYGGGAVGVKDLICVCRSARGGSTHLAAKDSAEISADLRRGRNRGDVGLGSSHARSLVIHEEERLVSPDRPSKRAAELILAKGSLGLASRLEEPAGVQLRIPQEFESRSVKSVSPRLNGGVDDRAAAAPEFRRVVAGLNLEFLDGIHVGLQDVARVIVGVVVDAVEHEVVQISARAVDRERAA